MIKAIITDFDGTLVDTFEANYLAYKHVLNSLGIELTRESYRACFGLRFNEFMEHIGVKNITLKDQIKKEKAKAYPLYFDKLSLNCPLLNFLLFMKHNGVKIAIASTARRENLINVLNYFDITDVFDEIFTGESVTYGKPHPEIYILTMDKLGVNESETLIFEDSEVGIQAADRSGASVIKVNEKTF